MGKLKIKFWFPFDFYTELNLETSKNFLFYRIIALISTKTICIKIIANLFFYSKPFVYLCIVRKTTIKFNKTKNKF